MKLNLLILTIALILGETIIKAEPNFPVTYNDVQCEEVLFNLHYAKFTGGIFLPENNNILVLQDVEVYPEYNSIPTIFDPDNCTLIREFETLYNSKTYTPVITKDGKYLITDSDIGIVVWEIATGNIVKKLKQCVRFCLSPDGTKIYSTNNINENHNGVIRVYDVETFEETEMFCDFDFWGAQTITCSPDGNTLAVCVSHYPTDDPSKNQYCSIILINPNNKSEYKLVESFYPPIYDLQFSPDGKYLLFTKRVGYEGTVICIYNLGTNEKKYISELDLSKIIDPDGCYAFHPTFLNNTTISFVAFASINYNVIWNIETNQMKKLISYSNIGNNTAFVAKYKDIKDGRVLNFSPNGDISIEDLNFLTVDEKKVNNTTIFYFNNQLEITTDKTYIAEVIIYDLNGKIVSNLGSTAFVNGKNNIIVNQSLAKGVYILNINSDAEQISKKFIIE